MIKKQKCIIWDIEYYNPRIRRFISTDNAIYDDVVGRNLYVYCYNNPVSKKR